MLGLIMRGLVIVIVLVVAGAAMNHGPFTPLPTASLPAVNVP